jgi:hypothetical protein
MGVGMSRHRPRSRSPEEVLERAPWLVESPRNRPMVETIDQLEELASLLQRGLLSRSEFDQQKRKLLDF